MLGITLARLNSNSKVYLVDSDIRAVRLSKQNAQLNNVHNFEVMISDGVDDLPPDLKFDLIISNPPTHQSTETLMQFIVWLTCQASFEGPRLFCCQPDAKYNDEDARRVWQLRKSCQTKWVYCI